MIIPALIVFLIAPLLSLPLLLIGYLYETRFRWLYSLLIGMFFGIIAYHLNPPSTYDLTRNHEILFSFVGLSSNAIYQAVFQTAEPVKNLIDYFVYLTGDQNLLQFLIVSLGYWIIFYILADYSKRTKSSKSYFVLITLFTVTSFSVVNLFSGLWQPIAMVIFVYAFYLEKIVKTKKTIPYLLYLAMGLIHSGMFFVLVVYIIYKLYKEKLRLSGLVLVAIIFAFPPIILWAINQLTDISVFSELGLMYNSYFTDQGRFDWQYGGSFMIIELLKLIPVIVLSLIVYKRNRDATFRSISAFVLMLSVAILVSLPNSILMIRFVVIIQLIGILLYFNLFKQKISDVTGRFWIVYLLVLSIAFAVIQIFTIRHLDFGLLFPEHILTSFFQMFNNRTLGW